MEKMAIGRINTLGTMYKQYARKNDKVSKKDIDNDYTVQN